MVPKILHFILLGTERPDWAVKNIERFRHLNPEYEVRVHEEPFEMAEEYQAALKEVHTIGEQSDVMRMAALETWGGWYFDWDVYAIKPLDGMRSVEGLGDRLLLSPCKGTDLAVSFAMACEPGVPAFETVRAVMAEVAAEGTPNGTTYERAVCDSLLDRCRGDVVIGLRDEFGILGPWKHANWGYRGLVAGTWTEGTGNAYFLHGWAGMSPLPRARFR